MLPPRLRLVGGGGRLHPADRARPLADVRTVAVTPESATSVVLTKVLLPRAEHVPLGEEADATMLIGDAALRARSRTRLRTTTSGGCGSSAAVCRWCSPSGRSRSRRSRASASSRTRSLPRSSGRAREPAELARAASEQYGYPAGWIARYFEQLRYSFGPRERSGLVRFLELARDVGELDEVPGAPLPARAGGGVTTLAAPARESVRTILDRALDGERITDEDAITLLESRDLVAVGRAADELRARRTDPDAVTFIVDRNLNYTNICVTDCDFCAFYRRPGDPRRRTCCRSRSSSRRSRRHSRSAAPACSCRAATTPTSASTTTRICSARSRRATRSTCTRCRRRRSSTSRAARG